MKKLLIVLLAITALMPALAQAQAADPEARYQALLAAAKSNPGVVDWRELRYAYADRPHYLPSASNDLEGQMFKAYGDNDCASALAVAKQLLEKAYINGMAHFVSGICYGKLGQQLEGLRERAMALSIFASIATGDGLSFESAFTVIAIGEEYDLLDMLDVEPKRQSVAEHNGHKYDVMETTDEAGKTVTYYFNIDRIWATYKRQLSQS